MDRFVISVYVENKSGVLTRVSSMFTRRGFNIDTLTVGATENPDFSRITITMTCDEYEKQQVVNQLNKLYNVKKVAILEYNSSVRRELLLLKVKASKETRQEIMSAVDIFRAKVIDYSSDAITVEVTGETQKIDAFIEVMKPLSIIELCRTGTAALGRGSEALV